MTETFNLGLWFSIKTSEVGFKTLISAGEGGRERRRSKVSAPLLSFSCPLKYLSSADLTTLYNFYVARKGAYEAFNLTVAGTSYLVRFAKDGLTWDWFQQNWRNSSIEVRQVTA